MGKEFVTTSGPYKAPEESRRTERLGVRTEVRLAKAGAYRRWAAVGLADLAQENALAADRGKPRHSRGNRGAADPALSRHKMNSTLEEVRRKSKPFAHEDRLSARSDSRRRVRPCSIDTTGS